jgi:hypothetical protein
MANILINTCLSWGITDGAILDLRIFHVLVDTILPDIARIAFFSLIPYSVHITLILIHINPYPDSAVETTTHDSPTGSRASINPANNSLMTANLLYHIFRSDVPEYDIAIFTTASDETIRSANTKSAT